MNFTVALDGFRLECEPMTSGAIYAATILQVLSAAPDIERVFVVIPGGITSAPTYESLLRHPKIQVISDPAHANPASSFREHFRWIQLTIPRLLAPLSFDLFLAPYHQPPALIKLKCKIVTVVHDLCGLGSDYPKTKKGFYRHLLMLTLGAAFSDVIIPISDFTATEFSRRFRFAQRKLSPPLLNGLTNRTLDPDEVRDRLEALGLTPGYVLCMGLPGTRKGFDVSLRTMQEYRKRGGERPLLMKTANTQLDFAQAQAEKAQLARTLAIGNLERADFDAVYAGAAMLLFPSRCEGFGYPVLEAMRQGTPVITSRRGPAQEIIGDSLPMTDELDPAALSELMLRNDQLSDEQKRREHDQLIQRSTMFDGANYGEELLTILRSALRS